MAHNFTVSKSPWGPDDEIGALNLITPESRAAIMSRVDGSRVFDLSCEYFVGMPTWSALGDPAYQIFKTHDPAGDVVTNPAGLGEEANKLTSYTGDAVMMYTHSGTHIDALNHFGCHGEIYNGYHAHEHFGNRTWEKCGVDTMPPIVARGIMLDIPALKGVDQLPASYGITGADLAAAAERQGTTVQIGDVVLVRTGRYQEWPNAEAFLYNEPGIDLDGAKWLVEQGAILVCSDNVAIEQMPSTDPQTWCPVHLYLFNEAGVPVIEVINCEELAAAGVHEFVFMGLPLKLRGASASPIRCIAMPLTAS